jgi:Flp pilus assembly protein TadB
MNFLFFIFTLIVIFLTISLFGLILKSRKEKHIINFKLNNLNTKINSSQKAARIYRQNSSLENLFYKIFKSFNINDKILILGDDFTIKSFLTWYLIFFSIISYIYFITADELSYLALPINLVLSFLISTAQVDFLIKRKKDEFLKDFPDSLNLMVRSVMAGLTIVESIKIIAKDDIQNQVTKEMSNINSDLSMGLDLEESLERSSKRVQIIDFDFFVSSIISQQKVGGNITEVLSNLIDVIKGREEIALKIKSASAEARSGAVVVGSLPIFIFVALFFLRKEYVMFLIQDPSGNTMLYISIALLTTGVLIMKKMINFNI